MPMKTPPDAWSVRMAPGASLPEREPETATGLDVLLQATGTDLRSLQVKLTYLGAQTKPVPSVVFTTFHHLIRMDWFVPLRRPGLHYGNDEIAVWNFTVTPDEIKHIVETISRVEAVRKRGETEDACVSLMFILQGSRLGRSSFEALLDLDGFEAVTSALRNAIDEDNGLARKVLNLQRQLILTGSGTDD
jgi:hypothetical protein